MKPIKVLIATIAFLSIVLVPKSMAFAYEGMDMPPAPLENDLYRQQVVCNQAYWGFVTPMIQENEQSEIGSLDPKLYGGLVSPVPAPLKLESPECKSESA